MTHIRKFKTDSEVPEGAVYLSTMTEEGGFIWHYFLVKEAK